VQLQWRGTALDQSPTSWRIRFDAHRYQRGHGYLDIALAGRVFATLGVALNGTPIASIDPGPAAGARGAGTLPAPLAPEWHWTRRK
jgi:rhamnogalacturonan endolyase